MGIMLETMMQSPPHTKFITQLGLVKANWNIARIVERAVPAG